MKLFNNFFSNPDKTGQVMPKREMMRSIVALGIMCMLLFAVVSCESSKMEADSNACACPCQEKKSLSEVQLFPHGEAYLFKDSIPEQVKSQILNRLHSDPFPILSWVVYCSETEIASITFAGSHESSANRTLFFDSGVFLVIVDDHYGGVMYYGGAIPNFLDFAKEWYIPENGIKIYFEGLMYEHSFTPPGGFMGMVTHHYYVLTSLKRK